MRSLKSSSKTATAVRSTLSVLNRKGGLNGVVPAQYRDDVRKYSRDYHVPEALVKTIMLVESRGVANAYSKNRKGEILAYGLMQLMPSAAIDTQVNRFNPSQNIKGGVKHMSAMLKMFHGDVEKAVAAYNWGPGNMRSAVRKYGENWRSNPNMPAETSNYVAQFRAVLNGGRPLS